MGIKPNLSLYIPDIKDLCKIKIEDISWYPADWNIDCQQLWITPPGFRYAVEIPVNEIHFNKILQSCDIYKEQNLPCESPSVLPDGIYLIKYSINPNDKMYVEYYWFRTAVVEKAIHSLMCCINDSKLYNADIALISEKINYIMMLLYSLKYACDYKHDVDTAMMRYKELQEEIRKLACRYCACKDVFDFPNTSCLSCT